MNHECSRTRHADTLVAREESMARQVDRFRSEHRLRRSARDPRLGNAMTRLLYPSVAVVILLSFVPERLLPSPFGLIADLSAIVMLIVIFILREKTSRELSGARSMLEESRERVAYALSAARVGTWWVDSDGNEYWSPSFRKLMGVATGVPYSAEMFRSLVHPEDREAVTRADVKMLSEPGEHEFEYRIVGPDGDVRTMFTRGLCSMDKSGSRCRVIGVVIDITERKRDEQARIELEQKLLQAQKVETIGRLAGGIAHDFNNLLTGISGFAELAQVAMDDGRTPREELDEIKAGAGRAAALTRQLLAFSRKQVLRAEVLDVNDVVRQTENLLERVIGEDLELEQVLRQEQVVVSADRSQLEQVILNLVVNAREAMPQGGRVTVEVDEVEIDATQAPELQAGRFALLAVTDTGVGMDAETAARIFEPFYTTKPDGTGLGLATVHGIVSQSGGTILVDSEPGNGTTFKVYLPLAEAALEVAALPKRAAPVAVGAGESVLVIEDDHQVRAIVTRMLTRLGYEVASAGNGAEALEHAESRSFGLILSDLVMPDMGGRELVEAILVRQPGAAVLFMSGYSDDAVLRRGVLAPDAAFIEKPFSFDELARRVRALAGTAMEAA
jgi:two-component system cell cycle sensor histidine kinase/response regulator CckA